MFAVVTDSTAYFTKAEATKMGIIIIPMTYTIDGAKFGEHYADENADFLEAIRLNPLKCKTSQPNLVSYESTFARVLESGADVLCISISSRLSGAYNSAVTAAAKLDSHRIKVIDSLSIVGGLKILVEQASAMSKQGQSLQDVVLSLEESKKNIGTVFSVENMDALRRSGRIGAVKLSIGNMLNIRPLLAIREGVVVGSGTARGVRNLIKELVQSIPKSATRIIVLSFGTAVSSQMIQPIILEYLTHDAKVEYQNAGPILAIHLGLEAFGIAWTI